MARPALSATRAVEVVNFLAAHPTESFRLSELAERLDINVASLHAVLATLTDAGYVARHPRHRTYTLGPTLVAIGAVALEQHPAIEVARVAARELSERFDFDVAVTARAGDDLAFVARSGIRHDHGVSLYVGERLRLRPPVGTIYYAWSPRPLVDAWLHDVATEERGAIDAVLAAVAAQGFSVTVETGPPSDPARSTAFLETIDRDARYDVSSIAGAVFDAHGAVVLTINFVGFPGPLTGAEVLELGSEVRSAGLRVTRQTRGVVPESLAV